MRRYKVETVDPYDMEESPDGDWVLYEDAVAAINAATLPQAPDASLSTEHTPVPSPRPT